MDDRLRLTPRKGVTAVIGLGYVGLPLVLDFCESGLQVLGLDIDEAMINALEEGHSYISYIPSEGIMGWLDSHKLRVSSDFSRLMEA